MYLFLKPCLLQLCSWLHEWKYYLAGFDIPSCRHSEKTVLELARWGTQPRAAKPHGFWMAPSGQLSSVQSYFVPWSEGHIRNDKCLLSQHFQNGFDHVKPEFPAIYQKLLVSLKLALKGDTWISAVSWLFWEWSVAHTEPWAMPSSCLSEQTKNLCHSRKTRLRKDSHCHCNNKPTQQHELTGTTTSSKGVSRPNISVLPQVHWQGNDNFIWVPNSFWNPHVGFSLIHISH